MGSNLHSLFLLIRLSLLSFNELAGTHELAKFREFILHFMAILHTIVQVILMIFAVLMIFNVIIFVHELGHFLAARWRGLQIDRFQIWFGTAIWKKEIKGVQYGLGWIPAGGFVALPQMASMDTIEGSTANRVTLPKIKASDKIIVAIAGPLFSLMLAFIAGIVVWKVGKPADFIPTQVVGEVMKDSPADKAGIKEGDKILAINNRPVNGFAGSLDSITEGIILSKGEHIEFTIQRPGQPLPLRLISEFKTEKTKWFQRSGLRQVGIGPIGDHIVMSPIGKDSPAEKAGLKEGDWLLSMNGQKFKYVTNLIAAIKQADEKPIEFEIARNGEPLKITATPRIPTSPTGKGLMLGLAFYGVPFQNEAIVHPSPLKQVAETVRMMWTTVTSVISPNSSIGVGHLSGPVGIAKMQYQLLQMDNGWRRILSFMVLFNVNLAILNMIPFPVLDGGHIALAILEKLMGRPVQAKPLELLQTLCAFGLIGLMLFVTSKDIGDGFGHDAKARETIVFPAN
jgi:regulator of sigma E protease